MELMCSTSLAVHPSKPPSLPPSYPLLLLLLRALLEKAEHVELVGECGFGGGGVQGLHLGREGGREGGRIRWPAWSEFLETSCFGPCPSPPHCGSITPPLPIHHVPPSLPLHLDCESLASRRRGPEVVDDAVRAPAQHAEEGMKGLGGVQADLGREGGREGRREEAVRIDLSNESKVGQGGREGGREGGRQGR